MAGALSFELTPTFGTDFSLNNLAAKRFKIVNGYFNYDAASSSALTVTTAMVGLNDIRGFVAASKGTVIWTFDPATDQIRPMAGFIASLTTTVAQYFAVTASMAVASITSVPFLCWGFE
jgi:hypothetical protein